MIADEAPTQQPDGSALEFGNLFWSRKSGKLYVYWNDGDSTQWTVCNPNASITSNFGMDTFPGGEVGPGPTVVLNRMDQWTRRSSAAVRAAEAADAVWTTYWSSFLGTGEGAPSWVGVTELGCE